MLRLRTEVGTSILSERLTFSGAPCRRGVAAGWCCYCLREYCSARRRRRCQTPGPTHRSSPDDSQFSSYVWFLLLRPAGVWIRIRINLSRWIRIQEGKTHKNRKK
jgi:hypothetical protein